MLTTERLRELAEEGAASMVVIPDRLLEDRGGEWPEGATHALIEARRGGDGTVRVLLRSRAAGLVYEVTPATCWCRHWIGRCQHADEPVACKHQAWAFPGGALRAGVAVVERVRQEYAAARADVAALWG